MIERAFQIRAATARRRPRSLRLCSRSHIVATLIGMLFLSAVPAKSEEVKIGSKVFTESVILGAAAVALARDAGATADYRRELGGTQVLWNAILKGEIDIYPEYTGTIAQEILQDHNLRDDEAMRQLLEKRGVRMGRSLGFNDTYAIGMKQETAARLGIKTISDLRSHPELKFGFSNEFMDRADGWPGLRTRYSLPQQNVRGLDHDLAYRAIDGGSIDATDLYSTDAEILYYHLIVLRDDLDYFPKYDAVLIYRSDLPTRAPLALAAMLRLEGQISQEAMVGMNARAKLQKVPENRVAAEFLASSLKVQTESREETTRESLWRRTKEHLFLVIVSLSAAILVSVPLGILAAMWPRFGQVILAIVGIIQTIPSLALLVFMIPLLGIGGPPAIVALFLYSLLPIVRNTYTGLHDIPPPIRESAGGIL